MIMRTKKQLKEDQAKRNLYQKAQDGDLETLNYCTKTWGLKIYTNEEIAILNSLPKRNKMEQEGTSKEQEILNIKDQEKVINLPSLDGSLHPALINWIEDIGDGHFRAGLSYLGGYPYDGGSTEWVLKLDSELGFKPLFCSLYWNGGN